MKKRMYKIMALAMTAAMVVPMAAQTTVFAADDKEITYWNIAVESPDKDIVTAAVDKFNKETKSGYTVNQVAIQNDTYKEKLVIAMSSGECPDMYSSWSGGPMYEYIDSGFAQPIDDLLDQSDVKDKLLDAAIEQGSYNGHVYAIPYLNVSLAGIFYNKDMFKQYGLEEPKTLADLENICATLKENGITPFALANASKWTGSMYFMSLAARYGGLEPFQNAVAGTGKFTDDCFIKAGEKIQEWVNNGYFPDGVNSLSEDDGQAKQLMYQETAGMLLCGSWYTGTFQTDSEEFYQKIGWFPFPAIDDSDADPTIQIGTVGDQFISFNCEGDKLAAAFECATDHLSDEVADITYSNNKIVPVKDAGDHIKDPVVKEIFDAAQEASSIQLWYDQYLPTSVATAHLDGLQEVFGLTKTPQEAQEEMQTAMVAINSSPVKWCAEFLKDSKVHVGAAISFPLGQTTLEVKVAETKKAIEDGADEIDYVINIGELKSGNWDYIEEEMKQIVDICNENNKISKVIFENCYLEKEEIVKLAEIAKKVKPTFVKTSTGFGTSGATVEDVKLMKEHVGDDVQVKAAGGIRDWATCAAMIDAGATRIGTSSGKKILEGYDETHVSA